MAGNREQANITHITLLVDASTSMEHLKDAVIRVVDQLVKQWEQDSLRMDDMTRLTLYQFSSQNFMPGGGFIECIAYDTDITRVAGVLQRRAQKEKSAGKSGSWFQPVGNTALIDATIRAQAELAETATLHGNHTFLFFAVTDGFENWSVHTGSDLLAVLEKLPDNWTMAALVPNNQAKATVQRYGFPAGNIDVWDATSERGVEEAGRRIAAATSEYMKTRTGDENFRGTKSLFVGGNVDAAAVKAANLTPLPTSDRKIVVVARSQALKDIFFEKPINKVTKSRPVADKAWHVEIKPYVDAAFPPYRVGMGYYELTKSEKVTGDKQIAVVEVDTNQVYVGAGARQLLGLPLGVCRVKPTLNRDYKIFVESTSLNRHLREGTQILLLTK